MLDFHFAQKWGGYGSNVLPLIIKHYCLWVFDKKGNKVMIEEIDDNYQRLRKHSCRIKNVESIRLEILATNGLKWAHVYALRVFE
jgi:hypothetical protein